MQTLIEAIAARIADKRERDPRAHIGLFSLDGHGDAERINCAHITDVGADFIEVNERRMIDRRDIREVHPINF